MAGTSSTLLLQYFGSKLGLYEAALYAAIPVAHMLLGPRSEFGANLAEALLKPGQAIRPPLMMALAAGDTEAAAIAAKVTEERSIAPLAAWLGAPNGRARALQIAAMATGLVAYTKHLPLRTSRKDMKIVSDWFAVTVQSIVDV